MTSRKLKYLNFSYSVFNVYRNGYHNKFDLVINIDDDRFANCRSISSLTTKISLEYNWTGRITRRQMCQSPCLIDEGSRPRDFHLRDSFIPSGRVSANKRKRRTGQNWPTRLHQSNGQWSNRHVVRHVSTQNMNWFKFTFPLEQNKSPTWKSIEIMNKSSGEITIFWHQMTSGVLRNDI